MKIIREKINFKKCLRRLMFCLAGLGMVLLILAGLTFIFLQTGSGRRILADTLNRHLAWENGRIAVDGLSGIVPFEFQFETIEIHDRDGVWGEFEEAYFKWSFSNLIFIRRITVDALTAKRLVLHRPPGEVPEEIRKRRPDLSEVLDWQWPFYPLQVNRLAIRNIVVPSEIIPGGGIFSLRAKLFLDSQNLTIPLVRLVSLDQSGTRLELMAKWHKPASTLALNMEVVDRMVLPELTGHKGWPEAAAIKLKGSGGLDEWQGALNIVAEPEVNGDFTVSAGLSPDSFTLAMEGDVEPFSQLLSRPWNEYASEAFTVITSLAWHGDGERLSGLWEINSPLLQFTGSIVRALPGSDIKGEGKLTLLESDPLPLPSRFETGTPLSLAFDGRLDPERKKISGAISAGLPDLAMNKSENHAVRILGGDLKVQADFQGSLSPVEFRLDTRGEVSNFYHHHNLTRDLAGEKIDFEGLLGIKDNMALTLSDFNLALAKGNLRAQGEVDFNRNDFSFSSRFEIPELSWVEKHTQHSFTGSLDLSGEGRGEFANPSFQGRASTRDLLIEEQGPFAVDMDWSMAFEDGVAEGKGALDLGYQKEEAELTTDFILPEGQVQLMDIHGAGLGLELTGDLNIRIATGLINGRLGLSSPDLSPLGEFLDLPLTGEVNTEIDFIEEEKEERQDLAFKAEGRETAWSDFLLDRFALNGRVWGLYAERCFSSRLEFEDLQLNSGHLKSGRFELAGNREHISFVSSLAGRYGAHPVSLESAGNYFPKKQVHQLTASCFQGELAGLGFALRDQLQLNWSEDQIIIFPACFDFGSGKLGLAGEWATEQVAGELTVRDFCLSDSPFISNLDITGEADLDLFLGNTPAKPELSGNFKVDNLELQDTLEETEEKLNAEVDFQARKGELEISGILRQAEEVLLTGDLSIPVSFSLAPVQITWPDPVPLEGEASGEVDLQRFVEPWLPAGNLLTGLCSFTLELAGDHKDPELSGQLELDDGSFEQLDSGLYLTDLQVYLQADRKRLDLKKLRATDGADGELAGTGHIELSPQAGMPWEVKLKIQNLRAVRQRLAVADIASAEIDLGGDLQGASIRGAATMGKIEIKVDEPAPPELAELPVTEINRPEADEPPDPEEEEEKEETEFLRAFPAELDLHLSFPARAYVRGHGLDSEWRGNLTIGGTADTPMIRGQLEVVRGNLTILNRRLSLDRESVIVFDGSIPVDPMFDLLAYYRRRGRQVSLRIYGSADHLEFDVTSDPAMPREEALAWLIFGRSLSDLTPIQAVQLINAARTLASDEPAFDVMGRARALLGVEEIEILPAAEGGTAQLGLGRYVHDRVFLQVRTGMGFGESMVSAEVELTPRISLESTVGAGRQRGVGIFWSYDY